MKFLRRFEASFHTRVGAYVFYALAAAAFFFLRSAIEWAGWLPEVYGPRFASIFSIAIAVCAIALLCLFLAAGKLKKRLPRTVHTVLCVLAGVLFGFTLVMNFGLDHGLTLAGIRNGLNYLLPNLLWLGLALGLPFVLALYPKLKKPARIVCAVLICVAAAVPIALPYIQPKIPFALRTNPLVLDIGGDSYSVVFAANRDSTAWLAYTLNGEEVMAADAFAGRMRVGRVHSVKVPRDHLNGNSYRVVAREVLSSIDSGTQFGAMIESPAFHFKGEYKDSLNILLATDWHDQPEKLLTASANFPEPDLFLMLGDYASNYNSEDEFILNTIAAGADVTKSEIPAIYTRGNHETYGEMTELVFPGLGLDRFYYQTRRGDYLFTVCDSVDWAGERFDRSEYVRGTANSENDVYREEQLAWLESLQPGEEAFHFAAVHRPEFGGDDQRARFYGELERLGADMQFSGHEHALHLDAPGTGEYLPPCPLFVAGGPKDGSYSGLYVCSMAQVSAGGGVRLLAWDSANEQLMDETVR